MNTAFIEPHLRPHRATQLVNTVAALDAAITNGMVPNILFVGAKDIINRAVEEGVEAFLATGPRRADGHHMSVWWHDAYRFDAIVNGTHNIPAALKRLKKAINTDVSAYVAFLTALLPLRTLLDAAKPLVKKRGEMPVVKTAKQIADEADQMTCQCCGRGIFAATGVIAHHGYERPGDGWQTASCMGARELPFEVSRDVLREMIEHLDAKRERMAAELIELRAERVPCIVTWSRLDQTTGRFVTHSREVTRATFAAVQAEGKVPTLLSTFDRHLEISVMQAESGLRQIDGYIAECRSRFNGWKQTHKREGDAWVAL